MTSHDLDELQARLDELRARSGVLPGVTLDLSPGLVVLDGRCRDGSECQLVGDDLYGEVAGVDVEVLRRWHLEVLEVGWAVATLQRAAPPGLPRRTYRLTGRAERDSHGTTTRVRAHARELPLDL